VKRLNKKRKYTAVIFMQISQGKAVSTGNIIKSHIPKIAHLQGYCKRAYLKQSGWICNKGKK